MTSWYELFVTPLVEPALQKAMIGSCLVAIVCGVIGCFVILRRMAFLGDALAHAMLAGVTSGYLLMQMMFGVDAHAPAMLVGSIIAGLITVALIGFVSRVSRIKEDTAIGIMYTGIFAVGGVLASAFSHLIHIDLFHFVTGTVLAVHDSDLWVMAIVASFVLAVVVLFFRYFKITTFDPVMAASLGIPVVVFDYLLTTCTSLVVVSAVSLVGVILVVGLLVTPAATAYLLCNRLDRMMVLAATFGVTGVVGGLYVATWFGSIAPGPAMVIVCTLQFLLVLAVAPRYGLISGYLRRRNQVPQQMLEDVIGTFRYGRDRELSFEFVAQHVEGSPQLLRRTLKSMERNDLIRMDGDLLRLTKSGRHEAQRLKRAHRLWEAYLQHVGTPEEELHEMAHQLEHVHDEDAVDYLDDKLGHPLTDPHGAVIPEDFVHLVPGAIVPSSLLREGHRGIVEEVDRVGDAITVDLQPGDELLAGPRSDDEREWSFFVNDREQPIRLDHEAADAVRVQLLD